MARLASVGGLRGAPVALLVAAGVYRVIMRQPQPREVLLIGVLVALLLLPPLMRRPTACVCALLLLLTFQLIAFGYLYRLGLPGAWLRQLGSLKELLIAALALRALQDHLLHKRRLKRLDMWVLAYLGVVTAYLLAPTVLPDLSPVPFDTRLNAWRSDVYFLVVLLAVRAIQPGALSSVWIRRTVLLVAVSFAAGAAWEYFDLSGWNRFLFETIGVQRYLRDVLGTPIVAGSYTFFSPDGSVRAGSILREPVFGAFLLLAAFFFAISSIASRRPAPGILLSVVIGLGMVCTGTRSALLVALLGAVLVIQQVLRSGRYAKVFVPVLLVALAVSPGFIAQTPVVDRIQSAIAGTDTSTDDHQAHLDEGLERIVKQPLGSGLATGGGAGQRFGVRNALTTENAYLQIGIETGAIALVLFIGILVLLARELLALPRDDASATGDRGAAIALLLAMAIGGFSQTVWLTVIVGINAMVALSLPALVLGERAANGASGPHPGPTPPEPQQEPQSPAGSPEPPVPPAARQMTSPGPAARGR